MNNSLDTSITNAITQIPCFCLQTLEHLNEIFTPKGNQWDHCQDQHRVIDTQIYRAGPL